MWTNISASLPSTPHEFPPYGKQSETCLLRQKTSVGYDYAIGQLNTSMDESNAWWSFEGEEVLDLKYGMEWMLIPQ